MLPRWPIAGADDLPISGGEDEECHEFGPIICRDSVALGYLG